ncbi:MAG TPA: AAA family ATPase, partial [Thermomicrobiaceae bacterium]|nr:AAA family ATPase [Thermomicrobiaceae bacterium]
MSTQSSLHLDRLEIERSPGIRDRYHLDQLSGGINIVYGPNAAGKTTTGQFLQSLLWPGSDRLSTAFRGSASLRIDGDELRVELEDGRAAWWRGGERISPPINDEANQADRYRLALHDLLLADNAGFALQIARESAGGYDLNLAARQLKYFSQPRGSSQLRDRFSQAVNATREARAFHRSIRDLEEELSRLQERVATRIGLNDEIAAIQAALAFIATRDAYRAAKVEAEAFPEGMKPLRDDDRERVNQLRAERQALDRRQT